MPKRRNLRGIPANLANSYLGTMNYYQGGYRADWIAFVAKNHGVTHCEFNVLKQEFDPAYFQVPPLTANSQELVRILHSELLNNGFQISFIDEAVLIIDVNRIGEQTKVECMPRMRDVEGGLYQPKRKIEELAYSLS